MVFYIVDRNVALFCFFFFVKSILLFCSFREIEIESDDETLYQSRRSLQIRREQHSSLPDLTETLANSNSTYEENSNHVPSSSPISTVAETNLVLPTSSSRPDSEQSMNKNSK